MWEAVGAGEGGVSGGGRVEQRRKKDLVTNTLNFNRGLALLHHIRQTCQLMVFYVQKGN